MAFRVQNGEKVEISDEELDRMWVSLTTKSDTLLDCARRAWGERLELLQQKKALPTEAGEERRKIEGEIRFRDNVIYDALSKPILCEWMEEMIKKGNDETRRAYGYAYHLTKNLGFGREATPNEIKVIHRGIREKGRPPFKAMVRKNDYGEEWIVPQNPDDPVHHSVFDHLEKLRQAGKEVHETSPGKPTEPSKEQEE